MTFIVVTTQTISRFKAKGVFWTLQYCSHTIILFLQNIIMDEGIMHESCHTLLRYGEQKLEIETYWPRL